jgi:hypothetical protein
MALLFLSACGASAFEKPVNKPVKKRRSYILVCDNIDSTLISSLQKMSEKVTQYLPNGYAEISFIVYPSSSYYVGGTHYTVLLDEKEQKTERKKKLHQFFKVLEQNKKESSPYEDKTLLGRVGDILRMELNDTLREYELILHSDLIENSGAAIAPERGNLAANSGYFRFVESDGVCVPAEIDAATRQLEDKASAIYSAVILAKKYPDAKWKINLSYVEKGTEIFAKDAKCNATVIKAFWARLFEKLHVPSGATYSELAQVPFFK